MKSDAALPLRERAGDGAAHTSVRPSVGLRRASFDDLPALRSLEERSFPGDRLSPRSWRRLLCSPSAVVTVFAQGCATPAGASVLLLRAGASVARLYSIAVDASARGSGIACLLLKQAILDAANRGCSLLRLETRSDNHTAQALFRRIGFVEVGSEPDYYEDGQTALRYQIWTRQDDEFDACDRGGKAR